MKSNKVIMVRIYLMEDDKARKTILEYLKNKIKPRGFSIFRAVDGEGKSGEHTSYLLNLSLNLPITIEFFDDEATIKPILDYLESFIPLEHLIFWEANVNSKRIE